MGGPNRWLKVLYWRRDEKFGNESSDYIHLVMDTYIGSDLDGVGQNEPAHSSRKAFSLGQRWRKPPWHLLERVVFHVWWLFSVVVVAVLTWRCSWQYQYTMTDILSVALHNCLRISTFPFLRLLPPSRCSSPRPIGIPSSSTGDCAGVR